MADQKKRLLWLVIAVAILLLIPFVAMQFTNEVNWTVSDFVVMGLLLLATGISFEFIMTSITSNLYRILVFAAVLAAFLLIWAELAVGIFGTPFAGS